MYGKVLRAVCSNDVVNPMNIATGKFEDGQRLADEEKFGNLMEINYLYRGMREVLIIFAAIGILVSLLSMLFVNRSEVLAERKETLAGKLKVVLIACSILELLNILTTILGTVF